MLIIGKNIVEAFFDSHKGHKGIQSGRTQYETWVRIVESSDWKTPLDIKASHPKASILKAGRVVFNIKANDFRLVSVVEYQDGILIIRFFGTHEDYDKIDAEVI